MKRILAMILALAMLASMLTLTVMADGETTIMPRYSYIDVINSSLSISKLGIASCNANSGYSGGASQKLICELQRYNGSSWTTVKTWTKTATTSALISKTYAVYSGYTYRLRTTCQVYNSAGTILESGVCNSNQVVY